MKSILDRSFRYIPSAETDLAATFRRVMREQKAQAEAERKEAEQRLHAAIDIRSRKQGAT